MMKAEVERKCRKIQKLISLKKIAFCTAEKETSKIRQHLALPKVPKIWQPPTPQEFVHRARSRGRRCSRARSGRTPGVDEPVRVLEAEPVRLRESQASAARRRQAFGQEYKEHTWMSTTN